MKAWGLTTWWVLLASGPFQAMGRQFRAKRGGVDYGELTAIVVTFVLIGVAGWGLSRWLARREEGKRRFFSRGRLFRALCQAHGLERPDRWLLRRLARAHGLKDPGRIFLEPDRFDAGRLRGPLRGRQADFDRLRQHLFGDIAKADR